MDVPSVLIIAILSISDPTLMTDSVAEVMELISNWDSLDSPYYNKIVVPPWQPTHRDPTEVLH